MHDNCRHNVNAGANSGANATTNISNNVMANANAMQVQDETMACVADDVNASTKMGANADATSMQCNSKH